MRCGSLSTLFQDSNNQTHWLDPSKRVSRQIRGNQTHHVTLYLGVKFYAADPCKLAEEITRYQFFLQVKLDILQGRLPVTHELAVDLAALALQCESITKYTYTSKVTFYYIFKAKWRVNNADGFFKEDQKSIRYECVYRQNNGFGWKSTPTIVSHKTLLINTISSACTWLEGNFKPSIQHLQLKKALSHLRFN